MAAFQYLNLALPNGMRSGDTLLTLGNGQEAGDLQGGTVRVLGALGGQGMRIGDRYTLIRGTGTGNLAPATAASSMMRPRASPCSSTAACRLMAMPSA